VAHSNLAFYFEKIAELYELLQLPKAQDLFQHLSDVIVGAGENEANTGELVQIHLGAPMMKYHVNEQDSLLELLQLRNDYASLYLKKEKELINQKEKLF
jgi:hypothetical protein